MNDIVEVSSRSADGIILIDKKDNVWMTYHHEWWDVFSHIRWLFTPGHRSWVILQTKTGKVRVRAVRLSRSYVRMG